MNKNSILSIIALLVLGTGVWWFAIRTGTQEPTPTVSGSVTPSGSPSSSASPSVSPTPVTQANLTITSPKYNELVDGVITVTGKARIFENQFTVQLKDSTGKVVYKQEAVMSDAKESGVFGNYSVKIPVPLPPASIVNVTPTYRVEALSYSPKGDGSFEGYAFVQVKLKEVAVSKVYAAFSKGNDCEEVTLYPREVTKTTQLPFMSLIELLKGPSTIDVTLGAKTSIPANVRINSYKQTGNTAYADFDQTLQQGVAGSCRVTAIRSQITNTLKQFLGINNVVISINGKTDDILQP